MSVQTVALFDVRNRVVLGPASKARLGWKADADLPPFQSSDYMLGEAMGGLR